MWFSESITVNSGKLFGKTERLTSPKLPIVSARLTLVVDYGQFGFLPFFSQLWYFFIGSFLDVVFSQEYHHVRIYCVLCSAKNSLHQMS
jgi:hypothetical protein